MYIQELKQGVPFRIKNVSGTMRIKEVGAAFELQRYDAGLWKYYNDIETLSNFSFIVRFPFPAGRSNMLVSIKECTTVNLK
jgi:hypothetical protein